MSIEAVADRSSEATALRDSARRLFSNEWPAGEFASRSAEPKAWGVLWRQAAAQGWLAIGQDDDSGGLRELLVLIEESGRAAAALPLAAVFVAHRLARQQPAQASAAALADLCAGLASGQRSLSIAVLSEGSSVLQRSGTQGMQRLQGTVELVEGLSTEGATADAVPSDLLLIDDVAQEGLLVLATAPGTVAQVTPGFSVPSLQQIRFDDTEALRIELPGRARDWIGLLRLAAIARAQGAAGRSFELAVAWAKERVQFGQPIGAFQALQHKLADCAIALESATELIARAASAYDRGDDDWPFFAAAATAYASPALRKVALEAQHTLAGVGYFEEHEAPRHFRRIHADTVRFGGMDQAREDLATHVLSGGGLPDIDLGASATAFRTEVRAFLKEHLPRVPARKATSAPSPEADALAAALVRKGWTGLGWPKSAGGQQRSASEQYVFAEEFSYHDAPTGLYRGGENIIGPTLLRLGSPAQVDEFIPRILQRKVTFCLGYSEPATGSDLASLSTRAERATRDGIEGWQINGSKLYTTGGEYADYVFLAARTDPTRPAHRGISIFLLPMNTPGITVRPMAAMHGGTACAVFYDNVWAPDSTRVGPLNEGWTVVTTALAHERILMGAAVASVRAQFDRLVAAVRQSVRNNRTMADDPLVKNRLGQIAADIEAARLLAVRNVRLVEAGKVPVAEAAMSKCVTGELMERISELALDLFGSAALLSHGAAGTALDGVFEQALRLALMYVIGGGTNEIQRNLIATVGLELPRQAAAAPRPAARPSA